MEINRWECPKMENDRISKNDGNSQKRKIPEFSENSINAGNSQKLNKLGEFSVLGGILVIDWMLIIN